MANGTKSVFLHGLGGLSTGWFGVDATSVAMDCKVAVHHACGSTTTDHQNGARCREAALKASRASALLQFCRELAEKM